MLENFTLEVKWERCICTNLAHLFHTSMSTGQFINGQFVYDDMNNSGMLVPGYQPQTTMDAVAAWLAALAPLSQLIN